MRKTRKQKLREFKLSMYQFSNKIVDHLFYINDHFSFIVKREKKTRYKTLRKLYGRHLD